MHSFRSLCAPCSPPRCAIMTVSLLLMVRNVKTYHSLGILPPHSPRPNPRIHSCIEPPCPPRCRPSTHTRHSQARRDNRCCLQGPPIHLETAPVPHTILDRVSSSSSSDP